VGGGNPDTLLLRDWLSVVAAWSDANRGEAPVTIVLDAKDDLTDNDAGDLEDLNRTLEGVFGQRLFTRAEYDARGGWPDTDDLRGRVLCVLSGHGSSRAAYRWSVGSTPAIAINARGDVALAYRSPSGDLRAWTGSIDASASRIAWQRKSTYAFASQGVAEPALALSDDGWLVAAYSFGPRPGFPGPLVGSLVGHLEGDGRIRWHREGVPAQGRIPTLQIDGDEVLEIHTLSDGRRQQARGSLNRRKRSVEWQKARATQAQPFARDAADWNGHQLRCAVDPSGFVGCSIDGRSLEPVRFRQLAFVEEQLHDADSMRDALFFGASAKDHEAIADARGRGLVARAWGFQEGDRTQPPVPGQENMPATDTPAAAWYATYMGGPEVFA
jgi:hypothetical protein